MEKAVYTVKDNQMLLGISKNSAYVLVNSGAFPVLKVGKKILTSKNAFDNWLASGLDKAD
jgi:excisionase family DNA binding protein